MLAKERLWLTKDGKTVVKEGDKKAARLLCGIGKKIPKEFESKVPKGSTAKESAAPANKEKTGGENKGGVKIIKKKSTLRQVNQIRGS